LPDKILASAREGEEMGYPEPSEDEQPKKKKKADRLGYPEHSEDEQPKKKKAGRPRKSKYKEASSESELTEESEQEEEEEDVREPEQEDENDDDLEIPPFDESTMGPRGGPFTKGILSVTDVWTALIEYAQATWASLPDMLLPLAQRSSVSFLCKINGGKLRDV
jgi:hypothetical protein